MAAIAVTRSDLTAIELRAAAGREKDSAASRRMLALAMVFDGADRTSAAEVEPTALVRKKVQLKGCTIIPDWLNSEDAIAAGRLSDRRPPRRGYRTFECAVLRRG